MAPKGQEYQTAFSMLRVGWRASNPDRAGQWSVDRHHPRRASCRGTIALRSRGGVDMPDVPVTGNRRGWQPYYTVVLLLFAAVFISYIDRTNISVAAIAMQDEFGWTETDKGVVLSSFFVGYLLLMVVSGALANRYGGWLVLGVAVIWWSLWTILTPPAAMMSLTALVAARIALGLGEAAVFPASINMIGRWVPPERRRAQRHCSSARSRLARCSPCQSRAGWCVRMDGTCRSTCSVPSGWSGASLVRAVARRCRARRWSVVRRGAGDSLAALLGMPAVWAIIVSHFASNWSLYILLAWLPSYFKTTFGVSLANAGLMSAAPWLVSFVMANIAGAWADRMLRGGTQRGVRAQAHADHRPGRRRLVPPAADAGDDAHGRRGAAVLRDRFVRFRHVRLRAELLRHRAPLCGRHLGAQQYRCDTSGHRRCVRDRLAGGPDRNLRRAVPADGGISLFGAVFYLVYGSGKQQIE